MSRTVVILGAGATRGAKFKKHKDAEGTSNRHVGAPKPALDGDFFERLQHIAFPESNDHANLIRDVIADARQISITGGLPTLEQAFTFIEAAKQMSGKRPLIRNEMPDSAESRLKRAIALQLGSCLWHPDAKNNIPHYQCQNHEWLVSQLDADDTIISFNYDCVIDLALRNTCSKFQWNPYDGYGVKTSAIPAAAQVWCPGDNFNESSSPFRCLKLHGSLHWNADKDNKKITLLPEPYATTGSPTIIPPVWDKRTQEWPFNKIWDAAKEAIQNAMSIIVIGYSMPATDVTAQVLFRAARQPMPQLHSLCVVNPDTAAAERAAKAFTNAVSDRTLRPRFDSWEELQEASTSVWHYSQELTS